MDNYMKLVKCNDEIMNLKGGSNKNIFDGGFPNLVLVDKNKLQEKKQYKYNIDSNINNDILNIQKILEKRREEKSNLIEINDEDTSIKYIQEKKTKETNIDINDII